MRKEQNTADRRVRRTQKALEDSFLALLKKKPVGDITISELCEHADINRSTFYMYYSSPMDLLEQMARESLPSVINERDSPHDTLRKICETIYENREVDGLLFGPHGSAAFLNEQLTRIHDRMVDSIQREHPETDPRRIDRIFTFYFKGVLGLLAQWIENDYEESPDEVAGLLNEISDVLLAAFS